MKKEILYGVAALALCSCAKEGSVTINLPADYPDKTVVVSHVTINNLVTATSQDDLKEYFDTLEVKDGVARMKLDPEGPARYNIQSPVMTVKEPDFYASPGDHLTVTIKTFDPLEYDVTGSRLMEDITALGKLTDPIQMKYVNLMRSETDSINPEEAKAILDEYDNAIKKFVADNPDSHAVALAILDLSGDDFKAIYDKLTPEARKSILLPYADLYNQQVEEMLKERQAEEDRKAEVSSGTIAAPGFTLRDTEGRQVSLSDFRGKWVVLDFWGSWCGWCVKGFPALKEAYQKYGDKIVVIGIDCNESEDEWRAGLKKYQLPWINVYNGNDKALYEAYNIEGFPTKAIINPEGKLVDLTTGEDPSFFTRLADFVK